MQSIPLTILSFFCLSLLYLATCATTIGVICKFPGFVTEAKIAKIFYISILIVCCVRCGSFGASTFIFLDEYKQGLKQGNSRNSTEPGSMTTITD